MIVLLPSRSSLLAGSLIVCQLSLGLPALAASGDTVSSSSSSSPSSESASSSPSSGNGTVIVEQKTIGKMYGQWTLLSQSQARREGALGVETASNMPAGNYTFFVKPPEGATSTLRLYRGNEELKAVERSQMSFVLQDGETLRFIINYVFNRTGTVAVESDPVGIAFTLTGPNDQRYEDVSPQSYLNVPEGQYKVQYEPLEGCVKPAPKSLFLEKDRRVSFTLTIVCETADQMREERSVENDRFVTVRVDGMDVVLEDVPQTAWFAPYIFNVARKGVLVGYRDAEGKPTGIFGPEKYVTIAELATIAHRLAGIDEGNGEPENPVAKGQWFSSFLASAEKLGWTVFADATVDPNHSATRGEVLTTLLQALDVPLRWQKGLMFKDVTTRTAFASAIETAATLEIVSGTQDEHGKDTGLFSPLEPINRAEMAKIIDKAMETIVAGVSSSSRSSER